MTLRTFAATALLVTSLISCAKEEAKTPEPTPQTNPNISLASIAIPTARCEMCEETITEAVKAVPGVTDIKADAKGDVAKVSFDSTKTNLASIELAIAKAGYNANNTLRDSAAHASLPECCQ